MKKIFTWDDCPNVDLRSDKVVWWNEDNICLEMR